MSNYQTADREGHGLGYTMPQLERALGEARRERDAARRAVATGVETEDALRAEIDRYRQRSRDEDTARIRLNHDRIEARDWLAALEAWASNVLGIVQEHRVPSADVIADGEAITKEARKIVR